MSKSFCCLRKRLLVIAGLQITNFNCNQTHAKGRAHTQRRRLLMVFDLLVYEWMFAELAFVFLYRVNQWCTPWKTQEKKSGANLPKTPQRRPPIYQSEHLRSSLRVSQADVTCLPLNFCSKFAVWKLCLPPLALPINTQTLSMCGYVVRVSVGTQSNPNRIPTPPRA